MSIEEGIRRGHELFNRREWDRLARGLPDDFELIDHVPPDERHARGPNAMREITEANGDTAFANLQMEVLEIRVGEPLGELTRVAVQIHASARGGASGAPVEADIGQVWLFDGDTPVRLEQFGTWEETLAEAGLRP